MPRPTETTQPRNRTIRWETTVDEAAARLAVDRRCKGGVSELLARLVMAEQQRKRGIAHLHNHRPGKES